MTRPRFSKAPIINRTGKMSRFNRSRFQWFRECFHMTSRRPYWCPKTMKRRPCWCPKPILWELNSFLMQTLSFVPINLHKCWPREWKHYSFASNMIKLSVNETKWSSLLARARALILYISIWTFDFAPEKLPGLSRNGYQPPTGLLA